MQAHQVVFLTFDAGGDELADDPQTGESWCEDCRLATPVIYERTADNGYTIIECDVGDKPT